MSRIVCLVLACVFASGAIANECINGDNLSEVFIQGKSRKID